MLNLAEKKVGIICHPYYWEKNTGRGHDRYAYELLTNLKKQKINFEVLDSGFIRSLSMGAIKEVVFPLRLINVKADIYHATSPVGGKSAILVGKRPLITTIHDLIPLSITGGYDHRLKFTFKSLCIRLSVKKSNMIVVPFQSTKDTLISLFEVPPEKIKVILYGVDHGNFFPESHPENDIKKILFLGEVLRFKGVDTLIRAFRIVEKKIYNVELLVGGEGRHIEYMKKLTHELKMYNKVKFLGFIPEEKLRKYYNLADIFVFPSRFGFGLPILEAMACGTPTISGATLDAPEFVGDAGLLVKPDDIQGLANVIIKVLTDDDLRNELSKRGLEKAKAFSWEKMAKEIIEVYEELMSI